MMYYFISKAPVPLVSGLCFLKLTDFGEFRYFKPIEFDAFKKVLEIRK